MDGRTIQQYYSSMKHFYKVYDAQARRNPAPQDSLESLQAWQKKARAQFRQILGIDRMEKCELNPEPLGMIECEEYNIERVRIQSAQDLFIPLTILLPKNLQPGQKRPVFLHAFGHGMPIKMIDHFIPEPEGERLPGLFVGPEGMKELVKEGYICVAFDSFGSGERFDYAGLKGETMDIGSDNPLNNVLTAMGLCKVGMEVWDFMRVADYMLTRSDCDGRISVGGTSGGGHQALFFAAADERVQAAATSVWFYNFKDAHIGLPHNCSCNYVPGLMEAFDCCDVGALVAPRALHVETGLRDYLSSRKIGLGNVIIPFEMMKQSYKLYGCEENTSLYVFDGGHGCTPWNNPMPGTPKSGGGLIAFMHAHMPLAEVNDNE